MENPKCKCGMDAASPMVWKCKVCGEESTQHDPNHKCGDENCQVKCSGCGEASDNCPC